MMQVVKAPEPVKKVVAKKVVGGKAPVKGAAAAKATPAKDAKKK
jgi:hypothetical protein